MGRILGNVNPPPASASLGGVPWGGNYGGHVNLSLQRGFGTSSRPVRQAIAIDGEL